jgi:hypothetical protein
MNQLFPREASWLPRDARDLYQLPFSKLVESLLHGEQWQDVTSETLTGAKKAS